MNYEIALKGDFMGNIFIFSLIIGLASALVLIPFSKGKKQVEKGDKQPKIGILITAIILLIVIVFAFYYFSNLDRNLTSLWIFALIITAIGAVISSGKERIIKSFLCIGSLIVAIYFLTAFIFNADEKYEVANMEEKQKLNRLMKKKHPQVFHPNLPVIK